jgi:hypothetical protein
VRQRDGAFEDVTVFASARAVVDTASADAVLIVVAAVGVKAVVLDAGPADPAAYRRNLAKQRYGLGDDVAVAAGQ